MEAVSRGCSETGGQVLGVLPGADPDRANAWVTVPLATGLGEARNSIVVGGGEAVVAVGGSWGTLSEISFAKKRGLPVGVLGMPPFPELGLADLGTPESAAEWAVSAALDRRRTE